MTWNLGARCPYKWPRKKWITGVITLLIGVITPFITGRGPPCGFKVFHFHPDPWGNDPIWRAYFSDGLKPPISFFVEIAESNLADLKEFEDVWRQKCVFHMYIHSILEMRGTHLWNLVKYVYILFTFANHFKQMSVCTYLHVFRY